VSNAKGGICLFLFLFVFGGVFAGVGIWFYLRSAELTEVGIVTQGRVVGHESSTDEDGTTYKPTFTFQTGAGISHTVTSMMGSNPRPYDVGDTVEVIYDPEHPSRAEINSFVRMWLFPLIFGGIGILILIGLFIGTGVSLYKRFSGQENHTYDRG
jgi:hypothetical protein